MAFGGRSQLKMSEETFDFVCTACAQNGKTLEAVKYCVECCGYCCQSCTDTHNWFPTLKNHTLMEVNQANQGSGDQSSVLELPTERCSIHKAKVVDMYCESHDAVGCYVCIAKDHKSCQDGHIHSIPDMIDAIYKLSNCKQTHSLLKDIMVSMETVRKSKDVQLQALTNAKQEALNKVTTFQKALEALVRKAGESSRQEVEAAYKELETEILQDKHNAENIGEDLKTTDDKLKKSDGNRPQQFVCAKIAQEKIKVANIEKMKQELHHSTDIQISFISDESLMKYMKGLQGIGQVQKNTQLKDDLYKIRESRDILIKLSDDSSTCNSLGCCLTQDNQLLVTDASNKKLKRIDAQKMSVVDFCTLDSTPYGVCCISKHEVAVACQRDNKIQFFSTQNKMSLSRQIKMSHRCYGIAYMDGKLYVTDDGASLYVYDMTGTLLKTITQDNAGNKLFGRSRHVTVSETRSMMFVATGYFNTIACFDAMGTYLSSIEDTERIYANDVCFDCRGNVFAVGHNSHNVIQFSENGKKVGVVLKKKDGLQNPYSVCFHQGLNRMFVTMCNSDVVKMYELE